MSRSRFIAWRCAPALLLALFATAVGAAPASAQSRWRLEQPAPPPGAPFKVPLGPPGDLKFYNPSRGVLAIEGNDTIPRGLFTYDGVEWRQLSTVCGGPGDTARIALAGPREFWVVSEPSRPRVGSGTALCRFKDGQVVASYSTAEESADAFRQMFSATCNGPNDCWFGGEGTQDPLGERVGAFHLHWDGQELRSVYNPQGRGVSDMEAHAGTIFESVLVGRRPESVEPAELGAPEPTPRLIHSVANENFANDPFQPAARMGVPADGTELLALDSDGEQLWAVGGGAASGPSAPAGGSVARPPLAARLTGSGFQEVPFDESLFGATERFADVSAVPGTDSAWVASVPFADRRSTNVKAKVALLRADGTTSITRLPTSGAGRGAAAKIAFTTPNEGWMITRAGWLFHYTDDAPRPRDTDPAFASLITFRPNEAAEQFVPDRPPEDDSQLFAPPPAENDPNKPTPPAKVIRRPALIKKVKSKLRGLTLTVSFTLTRRARVQLVGKRGRRTVARSPRRVLRPGRHALRLRLSRKRYPTRLAFSTKEIKRRPQSGAR